MTIRNNKGLWHVLQFNTHTVWVNKPLHPWSWLWGPFGCVTRCENCVETLFTRPSAACPECNTALRRNDFRIQQFEDLIVEKEVDIRKKILKMWVARCKYKPPTMVVSYDWTFWTQQITLFLFPKQNIILFNHQTTADSHGFSTCLHYFVSSTMLWQAARAYRRMMYQK